MEYVIFAVLCVDYIPSYLILLKTSLYSMYAYDPSN